MIDNFFGEFRFLSNFYPARVRLDGLWYPSVEHAYQAAKTLDESERAGIAGLRTAGQAKKWGYKVKLRKDWEGIKLQVMEDLIRKKFTDPYLAKMLKATGDHELVEGNDWGDTYWGVSDGEGQNHLGKILMKIRKELC